MTTQDALDYIQTECEELDGTQGPIVQGAIDTLSDLLTTMTKMDALAVLNDAYFDYTLLDVEQFGIATFVISRTIDPSKPFPKEKI